MDHYVSGADITRRALVEAALNLFGEHGYEAVSTRQIADHAAANIGSIAYHFGGKPGLRRAAAQHVIASMTLIAGPLLSKPLPQLGPGDALAAMETLLTVFIRFLITGSDGKLAMNFMLREIMHPGEVLDQIYSEMVKPTHNRLCLLAGMATGLDSQSEDVQLLVFSVVGQGMYFHIGRPIVMKKLDWDNLGEVEASRITAVLIRNLRAIIAANRRVT